MSPYTSSQNMLSTILFPCLFRKGKEKFSTVLYEVVDKQVRILGSVCDFYQTSKIFVKYFKIKDVCEYIFFILLIKKNLKVTCSPTIIMQLLSFLHISSISTCVCKDQLGFYEHDPQAPPAQIYCNFFGLASAQEPGKHTLQTNAFLLLNLLVQDIRAL